MTATLKTRVKPKKKPTTGVDSDISTRSVRSLDPWIAIASGIGLFMAFPPVHAWMLAWVAPIGWIYLAGKNQLDCRFRSLYLAGLIHWMMLVHWIRIPYWALSFGWVALAAYLAVYIPAFVLTTRFLIRHWKIPTVFAAPTIWTGLELIRGYAFTGFSISLLGHSQVEMTTLIQIADTFGAYGVSFVVVLVAAAIERFLFANGKQSKWKPLLFAMVCVVVVLAYGRFRLNQSADSKSRDDVRPIRVAMIQGAYDTVFGDEDEEERRSLQAFNDYLRLSTEVVEDTSKIDLVIWPESMFSTRLPYITFDEPLCARPDLGATEAAFRERLLNLQESSAEDRTLVARQLRSSLLVGSGRIHYYKDQTERYNSALLIAPDGTLLDIYDKRQAVMFGEYIPFAKYFPWVYQFSPIGHGLTVGTDAMSFEINGIQLTPFICFENTVPHLVRRQMNELHEIGRIPDCMVTVTNDGWFWGSSLLDVHLACGIFRAVEMDRPMLIAANTGFSAEIDRDGRVLQKGLRRGESKLVSVVSRTSCAASNYQKYGDIFATSCCFVTVLGMAAGLRNWRRSGTQ